MFDPIELARATEKIVCQGNKRKYYRFRPALFYGGIATADCVGCGLRCVFCWSWNIVNHPDKVGKFYTAEEVAKKLVDIAKRKGFTLLRISGNEPTLCKEHLLEVLRKIPSDYQFILETNGILIDEDYAKELSKFSNLHVRVSLKGSNEKEFSKLTGAKPEFFLYQLRALENLEKFKVSYHPSLILGMDIKGLEKRLEKINKILPSRLEIESLLLYPSVKARLKKAQISF